MNKKLEISFILPCLNESESIPIVTTQIQKFINKHNLKAEIILVDNGSTDDSVLVAWNYGLRVIKEPKKGYGYALRRGIKKARGKYLVFGDCDGSYNFYELDNQLKYLRKDFDAVLGNRFRGSVEKGAWSFSHRYIGVPFLSLVGRLVYKCDVFDFHCGMEAFNTKFIKSLKLHAKGFEASTEIIGETCRNTDNYIQVPVNLHKDKRKTTSSHISTINDGFRHLIFMLKARRYNYKKVK